MSYQPFDYSRIDHRPWPPVRRFTRRIFVLLIRLLMRVEVEGLENVPQTGAFVLVGNHLHVLDVPLGLVCVPRRIFAIVKEKWKKPPFKWLIAGMGDVIYVGESDRHALIAAVKALQAGKGLAILPEGTRSRTGGLGKGQIGAALLATRAPAPILPVVVHGQEKAMHYWKRLRRVPVYARIGTLIELPAGKASKEQLQEYTDQVMLVLAELLPPEYRGVYAGLVESGVDN